MIAHFLSPQPERIPGKGKRFVRRIYKMRVVGLGVGFFCVASTLLAQQHTMPAVWALLVLHGFIWPHVACYLGLRHAYPYHFERFSLMVDAGLGGFWVAAMHFNLLPSAVILAMLSMDNIAAGGVRLFLRGVGAHLLGALLGVALLGVQFDLRPQMQTLLACLPFMVLYPLALGSTTYRMSKQIAARSAQLELLSRTDGLTGLVNRPHWEHCLTQCFAQCRETGAAACLALIDLDHFKSVNDTRGHASGDLALQTFAQLLRRELREVDLIGRYGGEEFGVILPGLTLEAALPLIERLVDATRRMAAHPATLCPCTASIGLVCYRPALPSYLAWLAEVDQAMYRAKSAGRDRIVTAGEPGEGVRARSGEDANGDLLPSM